MSSVAIYFIARQALFHPFYPASMEPMLGREGRRKYPFLLTGWLWYLIILFPMSGMIGILVDKIADRYSYISLTGLFIIIAWGGRRY